MNDVPVTFPELKTKINFLVVEAILVGILIIISEIERLSAHIDFCGQYDSFTIGGKSVRVGLEPDLSLSKSVGGEAEDEDFTTDFSTKISEDESDSDS